MAFYIPNLSTLDSKKGIHVLTHANPTFKLLKRIIVLFILIQGIIVSSIAQTSQTITTTGAGQTFTVPAGVTSIKVECWGAGGSSNCNGVSGTTPDGSKNNKSGGLGVIGQIITSWIKLSSTSTATCNSKSTGTITVSASGGNTIL